jgi:aminocarboxymuconate-semialdehyde decarboxylase
MIASMQIDIHAHLYPEPYVERLAANPEYELARDALGNRVFWYQGARVYTVPEPNHSPRERIAAMDAAGVDAQILSLGTPNVYVSDLEESRALAVLTNDILAEASRMHPTRFRALASLPLGRADDAIEELGRAVDTLGMDGVQVGSNYRGEYLDQPRFEPLLAEMDRRALPVFVHPVPRLQVGQGKDFALCMILDFPFDTSTAAARLIYSGVLDRFPRIKWILSHAGGTLPFLQGRMDFGFRVFPESRTAADVPSRYLRRMYYDTVSSDHWPALACVIASVGAEQVVFGTDCPHNAPDAMLDVIKKAPELDDGQRRSILGSTALGLFPRLAAARGTS